MRQFFLLIFLVAILFMAQNKMGRLVVVHKEEGLN